MHFHSSSKRGGSSAKSNSLTDPLRADALEPVGVMIVCANGALEPDHCPPSSALCPLSSVLWFPVPFHLCRDIFLRALSPREGYDQPMCHRRLQATVRLLALLIVSQLGLGALAAGEQLTRVAAGDLQ